MSAGIKSGVNWMRLNDRFSVSARVRTINVLASPGTPCSRQCPPANMPMSSCSITRFCPTMTLPSSPVILRYASLSRSTACSSEGSVAPAPSVSPCTLVSFWKRYGSPTFYYR